MNKLILSVFPGIDLLGKAFEEEGYCVVRGPDILWGSDIREFHPPSGVFEGIIGGPPCQIFSRLKYLNPKVGQKQGNLIPEFERVVEEATPEWWIMENVEWAPIPRVKGYENHSLKLNNRWFGGIQERKRRFTFGDRLSRRLTLEEVIFQCPEKSVAVLAGHGPVRRDDKRYTPSISEACRLQGLPDNFADDLPFTIHFKRQVIGNGVPMPMGRAIAKAIKHSYREREKEGEAMYRMFIKTQKRELIDAVGKQGGGFIPAEIMVCQNFELAEPDPEARKHWHEIEWKDQRSEAER